jgi:hypothetical protein
MELLWRGMVLEAYILRAVYLCKHQVDAQNKFMGKSFEIRPTGIAHAEILLDESKYPNYPAAKGRLGKGKVVEHYSWKKVTTSVSGFLLGSPSIDHYGDMTVRASLSVSRPYLITSRRSQIIAQAISASSRSSLVDGVARMHLKSLVRSSTRTGEWHMRLPVDGTVNLSHELLATVRVRSTRTCPHQTRSSSCFGETLSNRPPLSISHLSPLL